MRRLARRPDDVRPVERPHAGCDAAPSSCGSASPHPGDALERIYDRFASRGLPARRCGALRDPQLAEDVVQDTFVRVLALRAALRRPGAERAATWVFALARRVRDRRAPPAPAGGRARCRDDLAADDRVRGADDRPGRARRARLVGARPSGGARADLRRTTSPRPRSPHGSTSRSGTIKSRTHHATARAALGAARTGDRCLSAPARGSSRPWWPPRRTPRSWTGCSRSMRSCSAWGRPTCRRPRCAPARSRRSRRAAPRRHAPPSRAARRRRSPGCRACASPPAARRPRRRAALLAVVLRGERPRRARARRAAARTRPGTARSPPPRCGCSASGARSHFHSSTRFPILPKGEFYELWFVASARPPGRARTGSRPGPSTPTPRASPTSASPLPSIPRVPDARRDRRARRRRSRAERARTCCAPQADR